MVIEPKLITGPSSRCFAFAKRLLVVLAVALLLSGCMLGKDYSRPQVDTPDNWRFEEKKALALTNTS